MDIKIVDVAKAAKVSPTTVSRVLNGNPKVKPDTRKKVLAVIDQLHYVPNASAKNLRSQKTMTLGVIVTDIRVSYVGEILRGIEDRAYPERFKVVICDTRNDPNREADYLRTLGDRSVDGLILVHAMLGAKELEPFLNKGYAVGLIGGHVEHPGISAVRTDNVGGAYDAVCHLIGLGHTSIAYLSGYAASADSYDRLEGYLKAIREHGIPFRPELLDNGDFNKEGGYAAFCRLLDQGVSFSAVFCANDEMALGVYEACKARGIRVPDDMSVVGYDNDRIGEYITPPLTSLHQPKHEMGYVVADQLIRRINEGGDALAQTIVLDGRLIVRDSTKSRM